jgi:thiamine kinase-like enzyme
MKNKLLVILSICVYFSLLAAPEEERFLSDCFPNKEIKIKELKGGLSGTSLNLVEIDGIKYVLRLNKSETMSAQDTLELNTFLEAAKMGITPKLYKVSQKKNALLMEYIDQRTLTVEQAKVPENIVRIAKGVKQIHQLSKEEAGESLLSKAQRCRTVLMKKDWIPQEKINKPYELVQKYSQELANYKYNKVRVHGDLNPRNLFATSDRVIFIDWAETHMDDPLYDLSFVALKLDYNQAEEKLFLEAYFGRPLNTDEFNRYQLHKKILQAFWSLTNLYLADAEMKKHPTDTIDLNASLKSWYDYQKAFADNNERLPAQYFYELSQLNYENACEF